MNARAAVGLVAILVFALAIAVALAALAAAVGGIVACYPAPPPITTQEGTR